MILLDTHAWVWWVCRRLDLFPRSLEEFLADSPDAVAVASVSCLEVALLLKKGRIELSESLDSWFEMAIDGSGLELLPLTPVIAARSAVLPDVHRDPIVRVIIATALEHDAILLTKDAAILSYPEVRARWGIGG